MLNNSKIESTMDTYKDLMCPELINAQNNKINTFVHHYKTFVAGEYNDYILQVDKVHYFAMRYNLAQKDDAIKFFISRMNEIARSGALHGCLAPISTLELISGVEEAVLCYCSVFYNREEEVKKQHSKLLLSEGDLFKVNYDDLLRDYFDQEFIEKFEETIDAL